MLLNRPITAVIFVIAVMIFGYIALRSLSIDLLPSVDVPTLLVRTEWEGASSKDVELRITEPLEAILSTIPNLRGTRAVSKQGLSLILLEFEWGQNMNMAFLNAREKLDMQRSMLPEAASRPILVHTDPGDEPIAVLTVTASGQSDPDLSTRLELKRWTDQVLSRRLEQVDGIAQAIMVGAVEPEIRIRIREDDAARFGLRPSDIRMRVQDANQFSQPGELSDGWYRYSLKIESRLTAMEELERIPLTTLNNTRILRLGDVADVQMAEKDPSSFSLVDGSPVLTVLVKKDYGSNQVQVYRDLLPVIDQLNTQNPGIQVRVLRENATAIEAIIQNLLETLLLGGILSFIVLFLFLNDARIPFTIGVAIPVSIFMTFFVMYLMNIQLNIISLSGLTLGIGLLVDNAIVVLENITRYRNQGHSIMEAARRGTNEIGLAVTASTFTTVSVFFPLVFLGGFEGVLFRDQAATLSISLMASLIVALTVLPVLVVMVLKRRKEALGNKESVLTRSMQRVQEVYGEMLLWSLQRPFISFLAFGVLVVLAIAAFLALPKTMLPETEPVAMKYRVSLPSNSALMTSYMASSSVFDLFEQDSDINDVLIMGGYSDQSNLNTLIEEAPNRFTITIPVSGYGQAEKVDRRIVDFVAQHPEWSVEQLATEDFFGTMQSGEVAPVTVQLVNQNRDISREAGQQLEQHLQQYYPDYEQSLIVDRTVNLYQMRFNPEKLLEYGLRENEIISWLESMARGNLLTDWNREEETISIRLYSQDGRVFDPGSLRYSDQSRSILLSEVATIETVNEAEQLERSGQIPVLGFKTNIELGNWWWIADEFRERVTEFSRQSGIPVLIGGTAIQVSDLIGRMARLLGLSVLLIYIILAVQYENLKYPFLVMFSVPFAWVGALTFLWLGGAGLNTLSFLGILVLTGIAVNDAILEIDFMQRYYEAGGNVQNAIIQARRHRFRPVVMTTLTTVLGLVPMVLPIGEGYELRQSLGLALMGGMLSAVFLTLFLIPHLFKMATPDRDEESISNEKLSEII